MEFRDFCGSRGPSAPPGRAKRPPWATGGVERLGTRRKGTAGRWPGIRRTGVAGPGRFSAPERPNSKRQPGIELPRLRLPFPERTGSDRDELRCPHGFVDRAYSVFLLRCVAADHTCYCGLPWCHFPPCDLRLPRSRSPLRRSRTGVNEGTSPRAPARPLRLLLRNISSGEVRSPRADGGARPARGGTELLSPHSPSGSSVQALGSRLESVTTRIRGGLKAARVPNAADRAAGVVHRRHRRARQWLTDSGRDPCEDDV